MAVGNAVREKGRHRVPAVLDGGRGLSTRPGSVVALWTHWGEASKSPECGWWRPGPWGGGGLAATVTSEGGTSCKGRHWKRLRFPGSRPSRRAAGPAAHSASLWQRV